MKMVAVLALGMVLSAEVRSASAQTEVSGFVDGYYSYNFNKPSGNVTPVRSFDVAHNAFSLNLVELALEKKPTDSSRGGFRVDLDYGPTASAIHAFEPAGGGFGSYQNIEQAYISYLAPTGKGLQLDFGKFVTPAGYEVIETKDNWNYSRGLLFNYAVPFYHAGARVSYSPTDKVSLAGYVVNGWNNVGENNTGKTVIGSVTLKPSSQFTIIENYIVGPELTGTNKGFKNLSDTNVTYTASDMLAVGANLDWLKQGAAPAAGFPASVSGWGVAGYLHVTPKDWVSLTPRFEYLDDGDAFMTGLSQALKEGTLTLEFKHKDGVMARLEYRHDFSNQRIFPKSTGAPKTSQDTVTIGLVYAFGSKLP